MYKRKKLLKSGKNNTTPQFQANYLMEGSTFDASKTYSNFVKTMLVSCFYAYLIPLAIPIAILTIILTYYVEKYVMLRVHSTPHQTSAQMV